MGYYGKEVEPKGAKASDRTGEKKVTEGGVNSTKFMAGASGEKIPKGATASDTSGERKAKLVGGVAIGMADSIGSRESSHMGKTDGLCGEVKGGSREHEVYSHSRSEYGR
jgi:hypothetical protein